MALEKITKNLWLNEGKNGWFTQITETKDGQFKVDLFSNAGKENSFTETNFENAVNRSNDWIRINEKDNSNVSNSNSRGIGSTSTSGTGK